MSAEKIKPICGVIAAAAMLGAGGATMGGATPLTTIQVTSGVNRPVYVTHAPGDFERIFVLEKAGVIRIVDITTNTLLATPFLNIDSIVGGGTSTNTETGLLGLAFHPNYQTNGYFYVNYTNNAFDTVVARYQVSANPNIADAGSATSVLSIDQPQTNHNGGWIQFGPNDGYLYIATGDGGGADDAGTGHTFETGNAQDITNNLLGKMLRIDVDNDHFPADLSRNYAIPASNPFVGETGDDEIWAYGLRNPWRNSFDPVTGDLYIADVGQNVWEEINFQPANSTGGENYGWRCREGAHNFNFQAYCGALTFVEPIQEYSHGGSPFRCSITGGEIYRGCAIPALDGTYFYADWCSENIWSFEYVGGSLMNFQDRTAELDPDTPGSGNNIDEITSFGRDAYGEIYVVDQGLSANTGQIFKIVPDTAGPSIDCNMNGIEDACEILDGSEADGNNNGVPDSCEGPPCPPTQPGDCTGNGSVDINDLNQVIGNFGATGVAPCSPGDCNGDGNVDISDVNLVLGNFGA